MRKFKKQESQLIRLMEQDIKNRREPNKIILVFKAEKWYNGRNNTLNVPPSTSMENKKDENDDKLFVEIFDGI